MSLLCYDVFSEEIERVISLEMGKYKNANQKNIGGLLYE